MEMTKTDFRIICDYIRKACGIDLTDDKEYLVNQRLESVAKGQGCLNFMEFALLLRASQDPLVRDLVVAAITTNETSFFRDGHPFEMFRNTILPQLVSIARDRKNRPFDAKGAKISIWSAASSTGQEPYSLSIIINEYLSTHRDAGVSADDFVIVATDISSRVLAQALTGEYSNMEVNRGLTDSQKAVYFNREDDKWAIKEYLKSIVEFRRVNINEPFMHLGGFDVIFCRNMLIYFSIETRKRIFEQFHCMLTDKGALVLGSTENMYGVSDLFESHHVGESIYYSKIAR